MLALVVAIVVAGTYSITRLLVTDAFPPIAAAREWVDRRFGEPWGYLSSCPWCASAYVAVAMVAAVDWLTVYPVPMPVVAVFALRATTGIIAELVDG